MHRAILACCLALALAFETSSEQVSVSADGSVSKRGKKKKVAKKAKEKKPTQPNMLVVVNTVQDFDPKSATPNGLRSCSTRAVPLDTVADAIAASLAATPRGECSLRAALEMASGLAGSPVTIGLRPGRYRLAAPLPDVHGKVRLLGSVGTRTKQKKKKKKGAAATSADEDDSADLEFDVNQRSGHQLAPIGTTLDGGERFQILRTIYGSKVEVHNVRFEHGRATASDGNDPRASLGGSINSLGKLTLNNTVVRRSRAINGGALYAEGKTTILHSVLTDNIADRCGGFIYTAGACQISSSSLSRNTCGHFDCKKLDASGKPGAPMPSWRKPAPASSSFDDDDDDEADERVNAHDGDASGAVTEGPSLLGNPSAGEGEGSGGEGGGKAARGGGKAAAARKGRRKKRGAGALSEEEESELEALAEEVEDDLDEEIRQRELEEADEADEEGGGPGSGQQLRRGVPEEEGWPEEFGAAKASFGGGPVAQAAAKAPQPKPCDAEKHGGDGGALHELSCDPGLWKTGRKFAAECVRWRATANCTADGERVPEKDRECFDFVRDGDAGYCECPGGVLTAQSACEHEPFTCQRACRTLRERRRREREREKRAVGLDATKKPSKARGALHAIGAFGSTSKAAREGGAVLQGFGLICSDGSRTALVGQRPEDQQQAWEFVCPGWTLCRDEDKSWDEVTHQPLCEAWAKRGECAKNAEFMRARCARSCNACLETAHAAVADGATPAAGRMGLAALDVRGGLFVDAVRFHCAPEDGAGAYDARLPTDAPLPGAEDSGGTGGVQTDDDTATSEWFGGSGGTECPLTCLGDPASGSTWRVGGLVEAIVVAGGDKVDRLELTKCSKDLAL